MEFVDIEALKRKELLLRETKLEEKKAEDITGADDVPDLKPLFMPFFENTDVKRYLITDNTEKISKEKYMALYISREKLELIEHKDDKDTTYTFEFSTKKMMQNNRELPAQFYERFQKKISRISKLEKAGKAKMFEQ